MSRLYIKVRLGFYSHIKTLRLKVHIGDDAFWVPPRMWAYAAEHKPDGDLSDLSSEDLAVLLGCFKHAPSLLQALKTTKFLDKDGKIHDWEEHNQYHKMYSERARKAALAMHAKRKKGPKKEGEVQRTKDKGASMLKQCSSMLEALCLANQDFRSAWNDLIEHRKQIRKKFTPLAQKACLEKCTEWGVIRSIAAIKHSISNGWQGVFEPDQPNRKQQLPVIQRI